MITRECLTVCSQVLWIWMPVLCASCCGVPAVCRVLVPQPWDALCPVSRQHLHSAVCSWFSCSRSHLLKGFTWFSPEPGLGVLWHWYWARLAGQTTGQKWDGGSSAVLTGRLLEGLTLKPSLEWTGFHSEVSDTTYGAVHCRVGL